MCKVRLKSCPASAAIRAAILPAPAGMSCWRSMLTQSLTHDFASCTAVIVRIYLCVYNLNSCRLDGGIGSVEEVESIEVYIFCQTGQYVWHICGEGFFAIGTP